MLDFLGIVKCQYPRVHKNYPIIGTGQDDQTLWVGPVLLDPQDLRKGQHYHHGDIDLLLQEMTGIPAPLLEYALVEMPFIEAQLMAWEALVKNPSLARWPDYEVEAATLIKAMEHNLQENLPASLRSRLTLV